MYLKMLHQSMFNTEAFSISSKPEVGELLAGVLDIVSPASSRVFVRVYCTSTEHFCVIYPLQNSSIDRKPLGSLNLRGYFVQQLVSDYRELRLVPRACDGVAVTFRVPGSDDSVIAWLTALTCHREVFVPKRGIIGRHALLPVLNEKEEDEHGV